MCLPALAPIGTFFGASAASAAAVGTGITAAAVGGTALAITGQQAAAKAAKQSMPTYTPPPTPSPAPAPSPSQVSAQSAEDTRRNQLRILRTGLASTIKTGAQGILDSNQQGRKTLG